MYPPYKEFAKGLSSSVFSILIQKVETYKRFSMAEPEEYDKKCTKFYALKIKKKIISFFFK